MESEKVTIFSTLKEYFSGWNKINVLLLALGFLIPAGFIIATYLYPIYTDYSVNDVAKQTVVSDYNFPYYDKEDIESILNYIQTTQPYYYNYDENHTTEYEENLSEFISVLEMTNQSEFLTALNALEFTFTDSAFAYITNEHVIIAQYENRFDYLYNLIADSYIIVDRIPENGLSAEIVVSSREGDDTWSSDYVMVHPVEIDYLTFLISQTYTRFDSDFRKVLAEILMNLIKPNAYMDILQRKNVVEQELENSRLQKMIEKGDVIITRGEPITSDALSRLEAFSDHRDEQRGSRMFLSILFFLTFYILYAYRFKTFDAFIFRKRKKLILAISGLIIVSFLYFLGFLMRWYWVVPQVVLILYGLVAILFPELFREQRVTLNLLLAYALVYLFFPTFELITFMNLLVLSILTIYTSNMLRKRQHFFTLGVIIGIINIIFVFIAFQTQSYMNDTVNLGASLTIAMVNGLICAMLSLGILPLLENVLNIPTKFRLMELSSVNTSPLLKKLKIEAPGTYNHSILIGDMAEEAADQLDVDPLLAKVGGYYHDIGKMDSPAYFIENQEGENKHDSIKPSISVSVIKSHVKSGIELAKKYRLPDEVIDFITQHHGTTTISYFYHQAMDIFGDENINLEDYTYGGPKPQSKATCILMLADSIEATVRAYSQHDEKFGPKIIQEIIEDTVNRRLLEGQLDESNVTIQELKIIKLSFFKFMTGYYHKRIEYRKSGGNGKG